MHRKMITPDLVAEIERQLAAGCKTAEVAKHLGISCYVVEVVAHNDGPRNQPPRPSRSKMRKVPAKAGIEYVTIRMIERLLSVGVFSYTEIAREVGVSKNSVAAMATGQRTAIMLVSPMLSTGERFLPRPQRCGICGGRLIVTPCRACHTRQGK